MRREVSAASPARRVATQTAEWQRVSIIVGSAQKEFAGFSDCARTRFAILLRETSLTSRQPLITVVPAKK
jgi:hypothetical protein